ncbi:hypothetical protein EI94DRAFT_1708831 [Lactarius quietus]|nr:hypothetical protein EI94DRAFT_1708831 [Lactarius quietus]
MDRRSRTRETLAAAASAPQAFLLALTPLAPLHALLAAYWGAAALSVPTREYFQPSRWSASPTPVANVSSPSLSLSTNTTPSTTTEHHSRIGETQSVRSGSGFWVAGHDGSQGSSAFSHTQLRNLAEQSTSAPPQAGDHDSGDASDGTEIAGSRAQGPAGGQPAAIGARAKQQDAKMRADDSPADACAPYIPGFVVVTEPQRTEGGRWKLDESLRGAFATELAGCRARRRAWDGLDWEMARAGEDINTPGPPKTDEDAGHVARSQPNGSRFS